jgi:hypothetical protein
MKWFFPFPEIRRNRRGVMRMCLADINFILLIKQKSESEPKKPMFQKHHSKMFLVFVLLIKQNREFIPNFDSR